MELPTKKPVFKKPETATSEKAPSGDKPSALKPKILLNRNIKGILPTTVLSEADRIKMAQEKEKKAKLTCAIKNLATILGMITLILFFFMKANISETNSFLSKFGIDENMGKKSIELENKNLELEMSSMEIDNKIRKFEKKIKNKYYTLFSEDIKKIRESQLDWFDKIDKKGLLSIGIIDGVKRLADYFNHKEYKDPDNIISGRFTKVEINNISANRKSISFSATTTQILGRIIFMDIELIDAINSFPIYKNGKHLSSFSREKNEDGDYSTEFSMNIDIQTLGEEDPSDSRFQEYLDWLKKTRPSTKIIDYKNINK